MRTQRLRRLDALLLHETVVKVLHEDVLAVAGEPLERVYSEKDGVRGEGVYLPLIKALAQRVQDGRLVQVRQRD